MIASLPMYDLPHLRGAHDALWAAVANQIPGAPKTLTRGGDLWAHWTAPDLLLSQTCGLPYRAHLQDDVMLVATPDYGLPDAPPGHYYSVVVAREDRPFSELREGRLAYNEPLSQSGWAAMDAHGIGAGPRLQTGAHAASAAAVSCGQADLAALDAVTWRLIADQFPQLHVIDRTVPTPGLPLITKIGDPAQLRAALDHALRLLSPADRTALGITGFVDIPAAAYHALPIPPAP